MAAKRQGLHSEDPERLKHNGKVRGALLQLDLRTRIGGLGQEVAIQA